MNKWLTTSVKPDKLTCGSCGYEEDIGWVGEEGTKYCPGCGEDMLSTDVHHPYRNLGHAQSNDKNTHCIGRPCIVHGEKAIFHQLAVTERLVLNYKHALSTNNSKRRWVLEDGVIVTGACSTDKTRNIVAVVEFESGVLTTVDIDWVCFLDSGNVFREHEIFFHNAE